MADRALGIDVGGTKVAAGVVTASGAVLARARADTPSASGEAASEAVLALVDEVTGTESGLPVGVGAAGLVDRSGAVLYAPNLPWEDYPLQRHLSARLGRAVVVENDGNAAAWGEYRAGAARDASVSAIMLTIGTGVGGGLVLENRLSRGANGLGAEFGHVIVAEGARRCACGNLGCLEAMASGSAIGWTAREWLRQGTVPATSSLRGLDEVTGAAVGRLAQEGDPTARAAVAECGRWLGTGIASMVNAVDPEVVVIGGGAADLGDLLMAPALEAFEERVMGRSHRQLPPVRLSELGGDAGLVGAGLLALDGQPQRPHLA